MTPRGTGSSRYARTQRRVLRQVSASGTAAFGAAAARDRDEAMPDRAASVPGGGPAVAKPRSG
jgi:hypothetical protein